MAINPTVSITAIGSLEPDSTRSNAAVRLGSGVVRIMENTAAASVDPTTAPMSPAVTRSTSSTSHAGGGDAGGQHHPQRGEQDAGQRSQLQVGRLGGEPTLEQDEQQRDDPDVLDQSGIIEADQVEPVVTEQHPSARNSSAPGTRNRRDRRVTSAEANTADNASTAPTSSSESTPSVTCIDGSDQGIRIPGG